VSRACSIRVACHGAVSTIASGHLAICDQLSVSRGPYAAFLTRMLSLPNDEQNTPPLHLYRVRSALSQIDERADAAIKSPNISSVSDWYAWMQIDSSDG
jgi:hypothetical protein